MKKFALFTFTIGLLLVGVGVWLNATDKAVQAGDERRAECEAVYGPTPANIREKATCLAEGDDIQASYERKARLAIMSGLVVIGTSSYVLLRVRHHRRRRREVLKKDAE